jgi:dTDP-4-amino-4,6-dideoxygalactose transaminase
MPERTPQLDTARPSGGKDATTPAWLVPLSDIAVDDEMAAAVGETLASGWWSMGPRVEEFEAEFAAFVGATHACAVANGTAALHLALLAAGVETGDEVIVPSLNFVAVANAISHVGATPVFCDVVGPDDLNLDPSDMAAAVTERTKALLVLHYGGFPCSMDAVLEIAERHGLVVIEDAAHAAGAVWHGQACGTIGRMGCFSFFSNKNLPVGEGGMIVTDDDDLARSLRLLRSHGMTTLTWDRQRGHASGYDVLVRGFNYRLDELRAAIGLVQLRRLREANAARGRIAGLYAEALHGLGLVIPFTRPADDQTTSAHHLAVVLLPDGRQREAVQAKLRERGVQTSVHYPPIHRFSAYANGTAVRDLPRTDAIAARILTLPLFAHMTDAQVELVADALRSSLAATAASR